MAYRNPSPPPDLLPCEEDKDCISETVLSKSWLLSVMVNTVEKSKYRRPCKQQTTKSPSEHQSSTCGEDQIEKEDSQDGRHDRDNDDQGSTVMELDVELEDDLCRLWDASINEDVAVFLHEHNGGPLLLHVSLQSMSPRLSEICIGVVANLVCHPSIASDLSKDEETVLLVCDSLFSSDPATLLETSRLILTCMSHPSVQHYWISSLNSNDIKDQLLFILNSSTHDELVAKVLQVIEKLMDGSQELLDTWSTPELVSAVYEASSLGSSSSEISHHLMLLQLMSTTSSGVDALSKCDSVVVNLVRKYLSMVVEEEDGETLLIETKAYEMTSALSILNILLDNGYDKSELSNCTEIQQVLKLVQPKESSMVQPETKHKDVLGCEDVTSPITTDSITVILQESVDKLVQKLK